MIAIAEAPDRVLASSVLRSNATTSSPTPAQTVEADPALASAGEYLSFRLADEEYGIDIQRVQEIRSYEPPTRIANAPDFIKGVVNLRGVIVPIVDLRIKLGCEADYNEFTVVIVLNIHERTVGAVVDSVSDVLVTCSAISAHQFL